MVNKISMHALLDKMSLRYYLFSRNEKYLTFVYALLANKIMLFQIAQQRIYNEYFRCK